MIKKALIFVFIAFFFVFGMFIYEKDLKAAVITNKRLYDSNVLTIDDEIIVVQGFVMSNLGSVTDLFTMADVAITQNDEYYIPLYDDRFYVVLYNNMIVDYLGYGFNKMQVGSTGFIHGVGFVNSNPNLDFGYIYGIDLEHYKFGYILQGLLIDYVNTESYNLGYQLGLQNGYDDGFDDGYQFYYDNYYDVIFDEGVIEGRQQIINESPESQASGILSMLTAVFSGIGVLLSIELLPNITIGAIFAIPLVFGIIAFIAGRKRE